VTGKRLRLPLLLPLLLPSLLAQAAGPPEAERAKFGHGLLDRLANTPLPFTSPDSAIGIDVQPKLADFVDRRYVRLPIELTYGFTRDFEGSVGIVPYFENPLDSDPRSSDGYLT